ncbi:hypothetical protein NYD80_002137 [Cronobacter sakazakii]|uniref:hypothetical protein n=1 Tax=Cronobacter sakazakii TaxID=28141 RepID=UPI000A197803|nr:hypothetical protein [Cronobacter sakazakii]EJQ0790988.1 hypothetical protein [Cronobacter sakazakii]EJQ2915330.1 hypothetical protein [Cronobacter sakazakii]EJR0495705.1 hypothetical protein [Cronobacter sakazakii]PQY51687.1 hypothetical protein C5945_05465 [Cronobacter sakazakii]PUZ01004.1 hypothetical protein B8W55_05475 [Cronobacter sakazakii]
MRALEILGLEPGADERAIKRAYARLLKVCRPDDDPQGFQQLRDAYETALEQARRGVADGDDDAFGDDDEHDDDNDIAAVAPDAYRQIDDPLQAQPVNEPEPVPAESAPAPPAPLYTPPRTTALLDGLNEENLNARWLEARAMGESREFEEAVLTRCLWHLAPDEYAFVAQAQACFEWLTPGQRVATDESQQNRLRHVLLTPYAEEMRAALEEGKDARYLACLRALANSPWLQSYDGQRQLQRLALSLLDAQPEWSPERFAALCRLFHWDETRGERPDLPELWAQVIARDEDEALFAQLTAQRDAPGDSPALRAAHMVLRVQDEDARMLAGLDYTDEDWQACGRLTDQLAIGHPALIPRFAGADIHAWQQTYHKLNEAHGPMMRSLWLVGMMMATFGWMLPAVYDGTITPLGVVLRVLVAPVVAMVVGIFPLVLWRGLARPFLNRDAALSERLLPRFIYSRRRKRWRLFAHVIPFCVVSVVIALVCGRLAMWIFVAVTLLLAWTDLWSYPGALRRFRQKRAPLRGGRLKFVLLALLFFAIVTGVRALLQA